MQSRLVAALCAALIIGLGAVPGLRAGDSPAMSVKQAVGEAPEPRGVEAALGEKAPDFTLADLDNKKYTLSDYTKKHQVVVLEWFNPDCPFVRKHHEKTRSMSETYSEATAHDNVVWLAINSGAPGKQGYGLERNKKAKADYDIDYPILMDESGEVGRLYGAKTTPHMFIIDSEGILVYAGAIDNEPNPARLGDTNYVKQAFEELFSGKKISTKQTKPYGCSVKYSS